MKISNAKDIQEIQRSQHDLSQSIDHKLHENICFREWRRRTRGQGGSDGLMVREQRALYSEPEIPGATARHRRGRRI